MRLSLLNKQLSIRLSPQAGKSLLIPALILLAIAPLAQAQTAADPGKPLAVVNGKEIPALYGELVKREMAQGQPDSA
jgi:hypothetical protein